jgi:hypothetical protein
LEIASSTTRTRNFFVIILLLFGLSDTLEIADTEVGLTTGVEEGSFEALASWLVLLKLLLLSDDNVTAMETTGR